MATEKECTPEGCNPRGTEDRDTDGRTNAPIVPRASSHVNAADESQQQQPSAGASLPPWEGKSVVINPKHRWFGSFTPVWLLKRTELTPFAKLLYATLCFHACDDKEDDRYGLAWPFRETLARELGVSVNNVDRGLRELAKLEYPLIHIIRKGKTKANEYEFYLHPWMDEDLRVLSDSHSNVTHPENREGDSHSNVTSESHCSMTSESHSDMTPITYEKNQEKRTKRTPTTHQSLDAIPEPTPDPDPAVGGVVFDSLKDGETDTPTPDTQPDTIPDPGSYLMPFGEHTGKPLRNIPPDRLRWILDNKPNARRAFREAATAWLLQPDTAADDSRSVYNPYEHHPPKARANPDPEPEKAEPTPEEIETQRLAHEQRQREHAERKAAEDREREKKARAQWTVALQEIDIPAEEIDARLQGEHKDWIKQVQPWYIEQLNSRQAPAEV